MQQVTFSIGNRLYLLIFKMTIQTSSSHSSKDRTHLHQTTGRGPLLGQDTSASNNEKKDLCRIEENMCVLVTFQTVILCP